MSSKNSKRLQATASHEAGHAVAALRFELPFRYATIIPDPEDGSLGQVEFSLPSWYTNASDETQEDAYWRFRGDGFQLRYRDFTERRVIASFVGGIAEAKHRGRRNHRGSSSDRAHAWGLISALGGSDAERQAYLDLLFVRAVELVANPANWLQIGAVASALLEYDTLTRRRIGSVAAGALEAMLAARGKASQDA